jgi:23S rRNA-/tRNA-specific pseudouridylate synthase
LILKVKTLPSQRIEATKISSIKERIIKQERTISNKSNLQVLHEDKLYIVVNKRVGDIVQGDKTINRLVRWCKRIY